MGHLLCGSPRDRVRRKTWFSLVQLQGSWGRRWQIGSYRNKVIWDKYMVTIIEMFYGRGCVSDREYNRCSCPCGRHHPGFPEEVVFKYHSLLYNRSRTCLSLVPGMVCIFELRLIILFFQTHACKMMQGLHFLNFDKVVRCPFPRLLLITDLSWLFPLNLEVELRKKGNVLSHITG